MGSRHRGKGIVTYLRIIMMRPTVFVEPYRIRSPQLPQTSLDKQSLPRASATTISPACDLNCMSMRFSVRSERPCLGCGTGLVGVI